MVSRKKLENICGEDLVKYVFRELNISKHHWDIELLMTSGWIGVRVIHKKSSFRIDKRVAYKPQNELKKSLLASVQSAISEINSKI